jgi:hypothetical protein
MKEMFCHLTFMGKNVMSYFHARKKDKVLVNKFFRKKGEASELYG